MLSHLLPPTRGAIKRLLDPSGGEALPERDGLFGGEARHRLSVEIWVVGAVEVEVQGGAEAEEGG